MGRVRNLTSAAVSAVALTAATTPAAPQITLVPRIEKGMSSQIVLERMEDFEAEVSLNVRTDPRLVPSARVLELVRGIDMRDGNGLLITGGYAIDAQHNVVIAWSGGSAEITRLRQTPAGLVVTGLFKDHQGRIVNPPAGSLAAYTIDGERICFEVASVESAAEDAPMAFALLLDFSGSMEPVINEVRSAAIQFVGDLPDSAQCALGAFAGGYTFGEEYGMGIKSCRPENFNLNVFKAWGATNIYGPLKAAYGWLDQPQFADHQTAVIVITDGAANENLEARAEVEALKGDTVTFVYWLGEKDERYLQGLADNYLAHQGDLRTQLGRYFEVLSDAYSKQTVMRTKTCEAGDAP